MNLSKSNLIYPSILFIPLIIFYLMFNKISFQFLPTLCIIPTILLVIVLEYRNQFYKPWKVDKTTPHLIRDSFLTLVQLPAMMLFCQWLLKTTLPHFNLWSHNLPFIVQVTFACLVAEFFFYWIHRFSHEWSVLWKFHVLHHSVREVHWLNSGALHIVDAFLNFFFYFLPLFILGVPENVFACFLVLTISTGTLEHANIKYHSGWLKYVFNTAELHRAHHSVNISVSQKKYGKITCIFDLIFRTFFYTKDINILTHVGVDHEQDSNFKSAA